MTLFSGAYQIENGDFSSSFRSCTRASDGRWAAHSLKAWVRNISFYSKKDCRQFLSFKRVYSESVQRIEHAGVKRRRWAAVTDHQKQKRIKERHSWIREVWKAKTSLYRKEWGKKSVS